MNKITLIIPYYRAPKMLERQLEEIAKYDPDKAKVIIVDDGSPEPAEPIVKASGLDVDLYRIDVDIPWNREQARNIGGYVCETQWMIQVDIDHIVPVETMHKLWDHLLFPEHWYIFPRFRRGQADFTRKKDNIHHLKKYGQIHPHQDSYLITRDMYMASPYNEEVYSGCLGGGTPFLTRMKTLNGPPELLPEDMFLEVCTTKHITDASITTLSRDTEEYSRRRKKDGDSKPKKILLNPWHKVELNGQI